MKNQRRGNKPPITYHEWYFLSMICSNPVRIRRDGQSILIVVQKRVGFFWKQKTSHGWGSSSTLTHHKPAESPKYKISSTSALDQRKGHAVTWSSHVVVQWSRHVHTVGEEGMSSTTMTMTTPAWQRQAAVFFSSRGPETTWTTPKNSHETHRNGRQPFVWSAQWRADQCTSRPELVLGASCLLPRCWGIPHTVRAQ